MPELPEVEATRRSLAPALEGTTITTVSVKRARMLRRQPNPADFERRLVSQEILSVGRHGKFLQTHLGNDVVWVTHLGMSGRISLIQTGSPQEDHS